MAASGVAEQITDDDGQTLDELIQQKVEEEVEKRVAEETAELRQEYDEKLAEKDDRIDELEKKLEWQAEDVWNLEDVVYGDDDTGYSQGLAKEKAEENGGLLDRIEDVEATTAEAEHVEDIKNTVARHDSIIEEQGTASGNSKEQKWQDTIQAAENLKNKSDHQIGDGWVKLFKENIEQATGCTDRRATQLIDEWDDEKQGTDKNEYKHLPSSRKTKSSSVQRKALKIDLDVWGDD